MKKLKATTQCKNKQNHKKRIHNRKSEREVFKVCRSTVCEGVFTVQWYYSITVVLSLLLIAKKKTAS